MALVIAPPCGQNPSLVAIADLSPTMERGMLGSGTMWISILAWRLKVKSSWRDPRPGQSVTLSPLTLPQSRDQAAGRLAHVVRRVGRGPQASLDSGRGLKLRLGEDAPANPDREGRGFGRCLKKLVAGPRTETELPRQRSGCWAPAVRTKIGSCVATLDSRVSVHRVTGRDPCVHPHRVPLRAWPRCWT